MDDLISRQAAIDLLKQMRKDGNMIPWEGKDVFARIRKLPSAQPEQKWIPCSERLPKTDNEVLITVFDTEDDYVEVYKGFYQDHEWWTQWCHGCLKIKDEPCGVNIVTAWMPLPEPYGGEQNEAN